jgi:predicted DNA-binding transcriptional regulator AlpA
MATASFHLLTKKEVYDTLGISRASFERGVSEGRYPLPLKVGKRAVRWRSDEVEACLSALPRMDDAYSRHGRKGGAA